MPPVSFNCMLLLQSMKMRMFSDWGYSTEMGDDHKHPKSHIRQRPFMIHLKALQNCSGTYLLHGKRNDTNWTPYSTSKGTAWTLHIL